MRKFIIAKLDTPLTLTTECCMVPQAEPLNFARALLAAYQDSAEIILVGNVIQSEKPNLKVLPLHCMNLDGIIDEETTLIIWQGRSPFQINVGAHSPQIAILESGTATDYERVSNRVTWYMSMHRLICNEFSKCKQKYFVLTDTRLPLLDIGIFDERFDRLPKGIKMLAQTHRVDDFVERLKHEYVPVMGRGLNMSKYCYQFDEYEYMPLHLLPIMSHYRKLYRKIDYALFQTQSLQYYDEHRLGELVKIINSKVANQAKVGVVISSVKKGYQEQAVFDWIESECGLVNVMFRSVEPGYYRAIDELLEFKYSIIVSEKSYEEFGLCPNRLIEALATRTKPLISDSVLTNCDDTLKDIDFMKIVDDESKYDSLIMKLYNSLIKYISNL